jgi:hypothetical protein
MSRKKKKQKNKKQNAQQLSQKIDRYIDKRFIKLIDRVVTKFEDLPEDVLEKKLIRDKFAFLYFCSSIINQERLNMFLDDIYPEYREVLRSDMLRMAERVKNEVKAIEDLLYEDFKNNP